MTHDAYFHFGQPRYGSIPNSLERAGAAGRWLYAVNPQDSPQHTARLLFEETEWHPQPVEPPGWLHYDGIDVKITGYTLPCELFDRLLPLYREAAAVRDIRFHEFLSLRVRTSRPGA